MGARKPNSQQLMIQINKNVENNQTYTYCWENM